jgi:hypothetical protein
MPFCLCALFPLSSAFPLPSWFFAPANNKSHLHLFFDNPPFQGGFDSPENAGESKLQGTEKFGDGTEFTSFLVNSMGRNSNSKEICMMMIANRNIYEQEQKDI